MIKLIVSDLDGTFLNIDSKMAPESIDMIKKLKQKGIYFAVASGRQYIGMTRFFEEIKEDLFFIAENGSLLMYQGEELYSSVMKKELVKEVLDEALKTDPAEILVCGKYFTYTDNEETAQRIQQVTHRYQVKKVDSLYEVDDDILKISIMERNPGQKESYRKIAPIFSGRAEIAVSGLIWYDIVNRYVNKGNTLKLIKDKFGIKNEEIMVFGDNYNDIEMFLEASHSYCMDHAEDEVKKHAKYVIGNHNDWPVQKEMKKLLL